MEEICKGDDNEYDSSSDDSQPPQPIVLVQQHDPEEDNPFFLLVNKVFSQDWLLEMIIDYAIHEGWSVSYAEIRICRLVQKSWLSSVSKLLRIQRIPLFILYLNRKNSLQDSVSVQKNGKLLDQFLNKALGKTSPSFMDDHIPPFSIITTKDFFKEENYRNFLDVLLKCGSGLVKINFKIPKDGGSMPFIFPHSPQLSLPLLTCFNVRFSSAIGYDNGGYNASALYLLQSILNASHRSMKWFSLPITRKKSVPSGLEYLTLPDALTELDLSCLMTSKDLRILLNSDLSSLTYLCLMIPCTPFDDGLISNILEALGKQLETLCFCGCGVGHNLRITGPPTYFKFPVVMENLKEFWGTSVHLELENDVKCLEVCLPKLNSVVFKCQTVPIFRKWIDNNKFKNVMELRMSLVDADLDHKHENYFVSVDAETMNAIHLAFPNLKILETTVWGIETSGIEYLLQEMTKLEELEIYVRNTEMLRNSDLWDSLLIGVGIKLAGVIRRTPEFREIFDIRDVSTPSIRNMKNLRALQIISVGSCPPALAKIPLISNSVFIYGFLKMQNPVKLNLGGRFGS